ncbi:MAG: phosphoenolpyruvate hydrolase family protein [Gammaproteobacteria bacterium]|nr:phosphoenolpyruvate hydrolase family protein [Gammaproteobacteria bacterium]
MSRSEIVKKLRKKVASGGLIVGAGAGTGLSAKCEEQGGVDLIVIYNSGRYRMAGRGSLSGMLAYGNANEIVKDMAKEVLTIVEDVPVLAGVNGTDPFMLLKPFLGELKDMGFAGIQNFPTVGLIDGRFRANLEETGMGYDKEVECIAAARELDLLTTPYVFDVKEAALMTEAGADTARTLQQSVDEIRKIIDACKSINEDVLVLCHGGPIAEPEDVQFVLDNVKDIDGFYGASSMERLPTERALTEQVVNFCKITRGK